MDAMSDTITISVRWDRFEREGSPWIRGSICDCWALVEAPYPRKTKAIVREHIQRRLTAMLARHPDGR
jgi:hypothetical protein